MSKRIAPLLMSITFFMASCQSGQIPGNTDTATIPTATVMPSETREVALSFTPTSESEAQPTETKFPVVSAAAPHCFITSSEVSPFAFMPDSLRILIKERSGVRIFNLETMEEETTGNLVSVGELSSSTPGSNWGSALSRWRDSGLVTGRQLHSVDPHRGRKAYKYHERAHSTGF